MIIDSTYLTGNIDAKYANFFLSILENKKHNELLSDTLIQEFSSGSYDYPDEFSVTGIPSGWESREDWSEVFHLLKRIEETLSHHLRKTYYNDAVLPMENDSNFNSVFESMFESMFPVLLESSRQQIQITMPLKCWNLLKKICEIQQPDWEKNIELDK